MFDPFGIDPISHIAVIQATSATVDNADVQDFVRPSKEIAKGHAAKLTDIVLGAFVAAFYPLARYRMKGDSENKTYQHDLDAEVLKHGSILEANSRVFFQELVDEASEVPEENLIPPRLNIAVPALQSASYCEEEPELRRLYVNLLTASMDSQQARRVQPGFVDVIRQMSPDEARIIHFLAKVEVTATLSVHGVMAEPGTSGSRNVTLLSRHTSLSDDVRLDNAPNLPVYLSNLVRLGIVNLPTDDLIPIITLDPEDFGFSRDLEKRPEIIDFIEVAKARMTADGMTTLYKSFHFGYGAMSLSPFGRAFYEVCYGT